MRAVPCRNHVGRVNILLLTCTRYRLSAQHRRLYRNVPKAVCAIQPPSILNSITARRPFSMCGPFDNIFFMNWRSNVLDASMIVPSIFNASALLPSVESFLGLKEQYIKILFSIIAIQSTNWCSAAQDTTFSDARRFHFCCVQVADPLPGPSNLFNSGHSKVSVSELFR